GSTNDGFGTGRKGNHLRRPSLEVPHQRWGRELLPLSSAWVLCGCTAPPRLVDVASVSWRAMKMGVLSSIKSRLVPDKCRVRLVSFGLFKGLRFEINLRSQAQLYLGLLERETYRAIRRAAQTAEWFVDIGAGKGELCAFFATLQRIKRVVAIEPNELEIMTLC